MVNRISFSPGRTPNIAKVDPRLVEIVSAGAAGLPPGYRVTINEGYNLKSHAEHSQHKVAGRGALDVQIWDPSGNRILNKGNDPTGMYTRLAKSSYQYVQRNYPDLKGIFAWGGSFGTVSGGKVRDLMHFDLGRERGKLGPRLAQLGPPVPPADIPDAGKPNMYGLQGNRGDVNPAMRAYAESKGYNYVPVGASGMTRAEQTAALMAAVKNDPNAKVIAFSQGGYAARDALKQGAQIKEAMIIGAPGVEGQFPGVDATFVPQMAGVDHMALPAAVAKQYGGSAATAYTGGPPQTAAQQAAAGLAAAGTLRKGATDARTGGAVTRLQQQLTNAGFDVGPKGIDGVYGTDTAAAVRQVEKQYRLTPDRGVAGTQVQAALAGNDRMRIVADTRRRFGAPLPGPSPLMGYPNVGQVPGAPPTLKGDLAARPYDSGSLYPGRTQAEVITAPPDPNAPPLVPPPQAVMMPHSLQTGVARGAPRPAPPVAPGGPVSTGGFPVQNRFFRDPAIDNAGITELVTGQKMTSPHNMYNAWAESEITRGLAHQQQTAAQTRRAALELNKDQVWPSASLSPLFSDADYEAAAAQDDTRLGQGPAPELVRLAQEAASRKGPSGPVAAGRPPSIYPDPNTFGEVRRQQEQLAQPMDETLPANVPGGPASPGYATMRVGAGLSGPSWAMNMVPYRSVGRLFGGANPYGGPPTSLGGDLSRLGTPGERAEDVPGEAVGLTGAGIPRRMEAPVTNWSEGRRARAPEDQILQDQMWSKALGAVPKTDENDMSPSSWDWNHYGLDTPQQDVRYAPGGSPLTFFGRSSTDVLRGAGGPSPSNFGDTFGPADDQTITPAGDQDPFGTKGIYGINADPSRLDSGTLDAGVTGGVPATGLTVDDTGYPDTGVGPPPGQVRNVIGAMKVPPPTFKQKAARFGVSTLAGALGGPPMAMLANAIMKSAQRYGGSFDPAMPYTGGPVRYNSLLTTAGGAPALTPYGTRQYQGAYGTVNSPFTPTESGWRAPDFNPISGGASYAYNPETHTYVDSQGRVHSYD